MAANRGPWTLELGLGRALVGRIEKRSLEVVAGVQEQDVLAVALVGAAAWGLLDWLSGGYFFETGSAMPSPKANSPDTAASSRVAGARSRRISETGRPCL